MSSKGKIAKNKSEIVAELPRACADELAGVEFLEKQRWGDHPACMDCGSIDVYQMKDSKTGERNKRFLWRCKDCGRQFTVRVGTVFEDSPIPLRHWCYAFWAACASKKGVSAKQIERQTGLSNKSALFMMHRIRFAMADDIKTMFDGTVECDETYVGGKPRYPGSSKRGRGTKKTPVVALVERNGSVRAKKMEKLTRNNMREFIRQNVPLTARIITDDFLTYRGICKDFDGGHHTVNHTLGEYVRGDIHTNTIEGFFSLLKRGMYGTFHSVSKHHLHRYLDEFSFRYNTRKMDDGERTALAIRMAQGKRLMYKEPVRASQN